MAVKEIALIGDDILRKRCRKVEVIDSTILELLDDMSDTMYANEGAGLAAPQIRRLLKLVVVDVRDGSGLKKMINPKIVNRKGRITDLEACLSIPGKNGNVTRPKTITVEYLDEEGRSRILTTEGFLAKCLCHEIDHLYGRLFIDKIETAIEQDVKTVNA